MSRTSPRSTSFSSSSMVRPTRRTSVPMLSWASVWPLPRLVRLRRFVVPSCSRDPSDEVLTAFVQGVPLYAHVSDLAGTKKPYVLPVPFMNVLNGGWVSPAN